MSETSWFGSLSVKLLKKPIYINTNEREWIKSTMYVKKDRLLSLRQIGFTDR